MYTAPLIPRDTFVPPQSLKRLQRRMPARRRSLRRLQLPPPPTSHSEMSLPSRLNHLDDDSISSFRIDEETGAIVDPMDNANIKAWRDALDHGTRH